jgi:hypothetical protein
MKGAQTSTLLRSINRRGPRQMPQIFHEVAGFELRPPDPQTFASVIARLVLEL